MKHKIWLSSPHMGGEEKKFVNEAFDANWVAPLGPNVDNFEKDLATFTNTAHCAALSSGTAAIHLALIILGIKTDDEVICQSFTFSASANPIVYQCAVPVFVDSEKETWNMDPQLLEDAIKDRIKKKGKKPTAVIAVHLYGMPAKTDEILEVCSKYEIPMIEDAAEALGSKCKIQNAKFKNNNSESEWQMCGSFGTFGILSFNGNKIITTSGGGALLSDNEEYIKKARFLATQARDNAPHYQHSQIGYNYRMSNICAGIGRGQMKVLSERVEARRKNYEYYKNALAHFGGISFLEEPDGHFSNRWLTTILVDQKQSNKVAKEILRIEMEKENIESRPLWKPMHLQPVFENYPKYDNGTSERLFNDGLCLPSGSNLTDEDRSRIIEVLYKVLK